MRPSWGSLCQTTAVSVATILGTGILGLPVSLYASGLKPFLVTFTVNLLAQLAVVTAMVELLQRARHKHLHDYQQLPHSLTPDHQQALQPVSDHSPSLHFLAALFIPAPVLRTVFNLIVLFHFLCILSAYALAGPQAYLALIPLLSHVPNSVPVSVFVVVGALLVVFLSKALLPGLTVATLLKAVLLTVLVAVTLARGLVIHHRILDNWSLPTLTDPFLMGTIALSGVVNLMPVTFQACLDSLPSQHLDSIDVHFVSAYRSATFLAILLCYCLNIAWSYAVLLVVPQFPENASSAAGQASNVSVSLSTAQQLGQISTVPLIQTLQARNDTLDWVVALLVNSFIALSVTVSFLVLSVGMKHFVDGESKAQSSVESTLRYDAVRRLKYVLYFSVVLITALFNPAGIFKIMEGSASLALNLEAGLFVIYMLHKSRGGLASSDVPLPLSPRIATLVIGFAGAYFLAAVLVDLFLYIPSVLF